MTSLGSRIRMLREQSAYPERRRFAEAAGVSVRGLEYIEAGRKVPLPKTLHKIIAAAGVSSSCAAELHRLRAEAAAARDGIAIQREHDAQQLPRLTARLVADATFELRRHGVVISADLQQHLHDVFTRTVQEILEPQKNSERTARVRRMPIGL